MKYLAIDIETTGLRRDDPNDMDSLLAVGLVADDLTDPQPLELLPQARIIVDVTRQNITGNIAAFCMNESLLRRIVKLASEVKDGSRVHYNHYMPWITEYFSLEDTVPGIIQQFAHAAGMQNKITVAGKNVMDFDIRFLNNAVGLDQFIEVKSRALDPAILFLRPEDEEMPSLTLCKERAGIEPFVSHDALDDAMDIVRLLRIGLKIKPKKECHAEN